MFLRVVLEVGPEMVGERVFRVGFRFEDAAELGAVGGELRELEIPPLAEADDEDAFAVLGDDALRVDDLVIDGVAERFGEGAVDDLEGLAAVVALEVLDVLQDERGGAVEVEDVGDGEEKVALLHVLEAVLAAEAQLLRHTGDAEGLAGKPPQRMSCAGMSATATLWMSPCGRSPKLAS